MVNLECKCKQPLSVESVDKTVKIHQFEDEMLQFLKTVPRHILFNTTRNLCSSIDNHIKITTIGQVTCIGLNRTENKNCLSLELLKQLKAALNDFEKDSMSLIGVLYGERGNFSYGLDVTDSKVNLIEIQKLLKEIVEHFCKKPLIAAISGFAVGSAFDLALWCDFRIIEETAVLSTYARNLGVPVNETTAKQLTTLVGTNRALDWILTGRVVQAKEAFDCGIATRVVACGSAFGQAVNFANSLCNMPQACLKADRATLLSMCKKYSPTIQEIIHEEKEKYTSIALSEVKEGIHLSESGDVRKKNKP